MEPSMFGDDPNFVIEIQGNALWHWCQIRGRHAFLFETLNFSKHQILIIV
jgi:hypothetical protein